MIEILAAAALASAQQRAEPESRRIGQYVLSRYETDCVLMREYRTQGQVYWLWIDSDGRGAGLRVLSPQWRDAAGKSFTHRLSLNGQPVADQMQGVPGPERTGGFAVAADAETMLGTLAQVNAIRIDDANGALVWGGSTAGLADGIQGLRDCVAGLGTP